MKIVSIGGGPAGLYFSILRKKARPLDDIVVLERNLPYQTFGWGVVFSDETLGYLAENDAPSHRRITEHFAHWDSIAISYQGQVVRSGGHGFSGIARKDLLNILQHRAEELGVKLVFETEVGADVADIANQADLVLGADGVNSAVRAQFAHAFRPTIDYRKCKYIWLGTEKRFDAFTFLFEENEHGLFQVHAYPFDARRSTFIVECDVASWERAGLASATPEDAVGYLEKVFARHLDGHRLLTNKSTWIHFPTVRTQSWHHGNIVLLGDAAHTAHFSIGSGTKLAMEDAIFLEAALRQHPHVADALVAYEAERRPTVLRTQKAAQDSLLFFENTKRYRRQEPVQFAFNLLTRSKRVTYDNLKMRDPAFALQVARSFDAAARESGLGAARAAAASLANSQEPEPFPAPVGDVRPPMFQPLSLRAMRLENRVVVSPMCMYSAVDGVPGDFHLVHLGSRALGGAGLIFTEMTAVAEDARITPRCTGMYAPAHEAGWKRIVEFVHASSRAKICLQLGHAGRKGATRVMSEGMDEPLEHGAWPLLSASAIPYFPHSQVPRPMDRADMDRVIGQYVAAARMGDAAGFDMLEIHAAHGYLLASFLSPVTNQRQDAYGGSIDNRMRFPLELFEAVRGVFSASKPMSIRISATDWIEDGFSEEDGVALGRALRARGCDLLDVSRGQTSPESRPVFGRMWQTPFSDHLRQQVGIPTMTVGNIASADQMNTILAAGRADLCALGRPHLDDPNFTLHAARAQGVQDVMWPTPYGVLNPTAVAPTPPLIEAREVTPARGTA